MHGGEQKKAHSQAPLAPKTPSRPTLQNNTRYESAYRTTYPLRYRLHSFLGLYYLRWISVGTTKEKLWPGDQNYAKETAY
jgi:hypothetical protein